MRKVNIVRISIVLGVLILVYIVLISMLLDFEAENPNSKIHDWEDALWYTMATLTTVGYGDEYPVTDKGRMIGFIFLLSSLGVYGLIIGQISSIMNTIRENKALGFNGTDYEGHVVMIGWNDFGKSVIDHIVAAGREVAIVTKERGHIDIMRELYDEHKVYTLYSDYNNYELLEKANIRQASIIFLNLNTDTEKLVYLLDIKKHFGPLNYVVTLDNGNLKNTFHSAGATYAISIHEISSKLLASYIYEPDVALLSEELIAYAHRDEDYDMKQFLVTKENPYLGHFYDKTFFDLKKTCNVILIGIVKVEGGLRTLHKNPESTLTVSEGDYLILLMDRKGQERLKKLFHIGEGV
jgi:voltage-gated potassium channel